MKLVEVLHVAKDDVFLVDNARRYLLHAAGHLPQVGLPTTTASMIGKYRMWSFLNIGAGLTNKYD